MYKLGYLFTFLFISFFTFVRADSDYTVVEDKAVTPILNPELAERKVLKIRLSNGLEAYLISDPQADQSGAVLSVKAGSYEDPAEFPGLAHFLEHMLFLGTKKYPKESEYKRFITENGGSANAYTSHTYTSYMFAVNNPAFPEALDRFSRFFIEPLFNPSGVSRELNAVDQEYAKNLENDDIRLWYLIKELANNQHPYHKFNIGNIDTLSHVDQETLKKWYKQHYSANLMHLVVYSPMPIDQLRDLVVSSFKEVPNTNKELFSTQKDLFTDAYGKMVYVTPVANTNTLTMVWGLPEKFSKMKDTQPFHVICHVLGDEGYTSLLAQLKREGLANSLSCNDIDLESNSLLMLEMELTDTGVKNVNTVIERIFQAIHNMQKKEIPYYLFDELKRISTIKYQYQSREDTFADMMRHADMIVHEDLNTYPEQTMMVQRFDPQAMADLLKEMTPEKTTYYLMAPSTLTGITPDKKEKWLNVEYSIKPIDSTLLQQWAQIAPNPAIDLPPPNSFLPKKLDLINPKTDTALTVPKPKLILNSDQGRVYFATDSYFGVPQAYLSFELKTPSVDAGNPEKVVLTDLYVKSVKDALDRYSYPASIAGLHFSITQDSYGINVVVYGYQDNIGLLLDSILKQLIGTVPTEEQFTLYREALLREYENVSKKMPIEQAAEKLNMAIYKEFSSAQSKANAIKNISYKEYLTYLTDLYKESFVEALIYGNMAQSQAEEIVHKVLDTIKGTPYPKNKQKRKEVIVLPEEGGPFYWELQSKVQGNAVILAIEHPYFDFKARAAQEILMQAINEPFFATLRTKQQTGYIVYSDGRQLEKQLFDLFAVQSNSHAVRDLLARFELFLEGYLQDLTTEVPLERFEALKLPILNQLEHPVKNVKEMGELLQLLAFDFDGDFDWFSKRILGLKKLEYTEFVRLAFDVLGRTNKRRLAILFKGRIPKDKGFQYRSIPSLNSLRQRSTYASWPRK